MLSFFFLICRFVITHDTPHRPSTHMTHTCSLIRILSHMHPQASNTLHIISWAYIGQDRWIFYSLLYTHMCIYITIYDLGCIFLFRASLVNREGKIGERRVAWAIHSSVEARFGCARCSSSTCCTLWVSGQRGDWLRVFLCWFVCTVFRVDLCIKHALNTTRWIKTMVIKMTMTHWFGS